MNVSASGASVGVFLLTNSLKAAIVFSGAWGLALALRKRSAALRHQLWLVTLAAALLLPALTPLLPAWQSKALELAVARFSPAVQSVADHAANPALVVSAVPAHRAPILWFEVLLILWAAGSALLLVRVVAGFARMAAVRARSTPFPDPDWAREIAGLAGELDIGRPIHLLVSADPKAMPLVWGLFQPKILVPSSSRNWPADRRRIVLLHELAHIARNDCAAQIFAEFVRALHWPNPFAWLAVARMRQESECACDDTVLNCGVEPSGYAGHLLALARTLDQPGRGWQPALAMARSAHLERRFIAMLNPIADRRVSSARFKLVTSLVALCVLLPLAAVRLPGQNESGKLTGNVYDASGATLSNATIIMVDLPGKLRNMTTSDANGRFEIAGLPPGEYEFEVMKAGFKTYDVPSVTMAGQGLSLDANLEPGAPTEKHAPRIRVSGTVQQGNLFTRVIPVYPDSAKQAGVEGTVVLHAVIGKDGSPLSLVVSNSGVNPELARSAVETVSHWRYRPTLLNGEPIEVDTEIQVVYSLGPKP
jgi:TonB family protein